MKCDPNFPKCIFKKIYTVKILIATDPFKVAPWKHTKQSKLF